MFTFDGDSEMLLCSIDVYESTQKDWHGDLRPPEYF